MSDQITNDPWNEEDSYNFIDLGKYFVPERELLFKYLCKIISNTKKQKIIWELSIGDGSLMKELLQAFKQAIVVGFERSEKMMKETTKKLAGFENRYRIEHYNMEDSQWRKSDQAVDAVVSSLAVHHLDGNEKKELFRNVFDLLASGGVLLLLDMIKPQTNAGVELAAEGWDEAVKKSALKYDNNLEAFKKFQSMEWNYYSDLNPDPGDKPSGIFEQLKWLEKIGYNNIDIYWMDGGHALYGGFKPD